MQLKARTTYKARCGNTVTIAGISKRTVDGKQCWWSIQGNHYTDDGLYVYIRRVPGTSLDMLQLESYTLPNSERNFVSEDDSEAARKWWNGVWGQVL